MLEERDWLTIFGQIGAGWRHDGNPKRPYARITSGKITDAYCDCSKLIERPKLLQLAIEDLIKRCRPHHPPRMDIDVVCGSAFGSIPIATEYARQLDCRAWFTIKGQSGSRELDRFHPDGDERVLLVDDVLTSGGTLERTMSALFEKRVKLAPYIPVIMNRSGLRQLCGMDIVALMEVNDGCEWQEGENPYTPDGRELVEPVHPRRDWRILNAHY